MAESRPANRLIHETSPYLLQHAHNPVDWYPWGEEAFEKARREEKPLFVSVGYSTCHWCHVMERESFENERIAELLNTHFVPVKVDREERPDVDRVYMAFVQATTGGGGWPMSVWLTPELRPFYGGTYFPPEDRWGRVGFASVLERLAAAWRSDRAQITASSVDIVEQLNKHLRVGGDLSLAADARTLESGFYAFRRTFDARYGGFGQAPKFPRPSTFEFLLRYHARTGAGEALEMTLATLGAMARGGMHDQLGGGFHRYSVDERWFVPHFEKMLYDQAQLAVVYTQAWQITGDPAWAGIARDILDYVLRDLRSPEGGFYSAEDADSAADPAHPEVKSEGAFYLWTREDLGPGAEWFAYRYGVEAGGNVAADPHDEFHGRNILSEVHTVEETAAHFGRPVEEVQATLRETARRLLEARNRRPRPHLDDKVLTAWNGLMISAFATAGAALEEPVYLEAARRAAGFVTAQLLREGELLRRYRDGEAAISGFLDDYAFFIQGLLDLYEADFDPGHLQLAVTLTDAMRKRFEDSEGGFYAAADDPALVLRIKEDYDGAEPSGNSVAILNLLRLAQITARSDLQESAERGLRAFAARMAAGPEAMPRMLVAAEFLAAKPRQVIVVGERGDAGTQALVRTVHKRFLPNKVLLLVDDAAARGVISGYLPVVLDMTKLEGRAAAYVCQDYTCRLPVAEPGKLAELLE